MGASRKPRPTKQVLRGLREAVAAWLADEHDEGADVAAVEAAERWLDEMQADTQENER